MTSRLECLVKISYAKILVSDLATEKKRPGFIGNFNCNHADGSPIVKGCSVEIWRANIERVIAGVSEWLGENLDNGVSDRLEELRDKYREAIK